METEIPADEALAYSACAYRCKAARRADADLLFVGRRLRKRQVLPGRTKREVLGHRRSRRGDGKGEGPEAPRGDVGRMAHSRPPDAPAICTLCRTIQSGRPRDRLRRYRRALALQLRHDAGAIFGRPGAAVEAGGTALPR